jgi:hypothetical protein
VTDKVVSLRGDRVPTGEPNEVCPEIVKLCEDLLERAKSGDITEIAVTCAGPVVASQNWFLHSGCLNDWIALLGRLDMMHSQLRAWIIEQVQDCSENRG